MQEQKILDFLGGQNRCNDGARCADCLENQDCSAGEVINLFKMRDDYTFRCFVDHCDSLMGIDVFEGIEYHEMWCLSSIVFATEIFDCMFNVVDTFWSLKLFQRCQSGFCRRRPRRTRTGWGKKHIICFRFTIEQQKYTNKTCRCNLASDHFNWGFHDFS